MNFIDVECCNWNLHVKLIAEVNKGGMTVILVKTVTYVYAMSLTTSHSLALFLSSASQTMLFLSLSL